jgi:hypothetical protein
MTTGVKCICAAPGNRAACAPPTPSELAASTRPLLRTTAAVIAALLQALLCRHITTRGGQAALNAAMTRAFSARSLPRINWGSLGWSSLLSHTTPMSAEQHRRFQPATRWVGKPARPRAGKTVPCLRPGHSRTAVSSRLKRKIDFPRLAARASTWLNHCHDADADDGARVYATLHNALTASTQTNTCASPMRVDPEHTQGRTPCPRTAFTTADRSFDVPRNADQRLRLACPKLSHVCHAKTQSRGAL